jgi:hypothetical protein
MAYQAMNVTGVVASLQPTPRLRWVTHVHGHGGRKLEQLWRNPSTEEEQWREVEETLRERD